LPGNASSLGRYGPSKKKTREVWFRVLRPLGLHGLAPCPGLTYLDWWLHSRLLLPSVLRQGFDSRVILVAWCTWKERNLRVFQGQVRSPATLVITIVEEADRWSLAGFSQLAALAGMTA
jgi:hypothetical protein